MPWALSNMGLMGGRLEARDAALRAHGPSLDGCGEAQGVVGAVIEESPGLAAVAGDVGSGGASDHVKLAARQPDDGGTEAFGTQARRGLPRAAAIGGDGDRKSTRLNSSHRC